jgi:hypothetical protein
MLGRRWKALSWDNTSFETTRVLKALAMGGHGEEHGVKVGREGRSFATEKESKLYLYSYLRANMCQNHTIYLEYFSCLI